MDVARARELAASSLAWLEASRNHIDDLNVYPVPDGDTGTNLTLTLRAVVEALERSDAVGPAAVAKELSDAALRGACGNSGVILSQIVRGFAEVIGRHEEIDGAVLAAAFRSASDAAYRAVRRPVEGTMLTVIREMAEEGEQADVRTLPAEELLRRVVARGEQALARTPELLPVLREAGVVDAGGAGLLEIVRGLAAGVAGEEPPVAAPAARELSLDAVHQELSRYRYCTVFLVEGDGLDPEGLESDLERLGDSLLVVGGSDLLKVHVHTDDPGAALSLGVARGTIGGVEIANMHQQTAAREARLATGVAPLESIPTMRSALVVVAPGSGTRGLFEAEGAVRVVEGGQTMNPSAGDIAEAIALAPVDDVLVLPNNSNVVLSAEQAAGLVAKRVHIVPTTTVQAGLCAAFAYSREASLEENEAAMLEAIAHVATGEVTTASRSVVLDGVDVAAGQWLGLANGKAVVSDADFDTVVDRVVDVLLDGDGSLLNALVGADGPDPEAVQARLADVHPEVEVHVYAGGQPHYPLLLWAEP